MKSLDMHNHLKAISVDQNRVYKMMSKCLNPPNPPEEPNSRALPRPSFSLKCRKEHQFSKAVDREGVGSRGARPFMGSSPWCKKWIITVGKTNYVKYYLQGKH